MKQQGSVVVMVLKWPRAAKRKPLLSSVFRVGALSVAAIELTFSPDEYVSVSPLVPVIGAALYTCAKIVQPLHWYQSRRAAVVLTAFDVAVCLALALIPGRIHAPFAAYTLAPVLTSALLLGAGTTVVVAIITATYYTLVYFSFPSALAMEHLSSHLGTYLTALALTAALPYTVNTASKRRLQSHAVHEERLRLAREIHDGLCQTIYGLRWETQMLAHDKGLAEKLGKLDRLLDEAEKDARGSIETLSSFKTDQGFLAQIQEHLGRLERDYGMQWHLEAPPREPRLDPLVKLETLHVCEEALRNVGKHSAAHCVWVTVGAPDGHLLVDIADDGKGLASPSFVQGHGLMVMKQRAESLGGHLQALSIPGMGTEIRLEVPRKCPRWPAIARE
ncbi:MAG: hypothetical protein HYY01_03740 [Chloroflexi bacterium]|nr:hypothetical protein [Chloroflexota bacterium]